MLYAKLDASLFITGSEGERVRFGEDLVGHLKRDGFVKLTNHGIPEDFLGDIFTWEQRFFDLPIGTKTTCAHKGGPVPVRGYNAYSQEKSWKLSPGNEKLTDAKDARESLDIGPLNDTCYPNRWISEESLPTFRQHIESYYTAFQNTANYLLEAIELGLALSPGTLGSRTFPDASELRLNHYPTISKRELSATNTRRIWPHTDLGILSLLIQDNQGGLEFEDRTSPGSFFPVLNEEHSDLIVNVSDMLERWTNGVLRAGLHRVVVPQQQQGKDGGEIDCMLPDRYSVVFLYRPGEKNSAGPIEDFVSKDRPAICEEVSALVYLKKMNDRVYG